MRQALYDLAAKKQTVSLTINSDLFTKVRQSGINASQVAEAALAEALTERVANAVKMEIQQDLRAYNAYVAEHGSPVEMAREHYLERDDAV